MTDQEPEKPTTAEALQEWRSAERNCRGRSTGPAGSRGGRDGRG